MKPYWSIIMSKLSQEMY